MKIEQTTATFRPIVITLETQEDAEQFYRMVSHAYESSYGGSVVETTALSYKRVFDDESMIPYKENF